MKIDFKIIKRICRAMDYTLIQFRPVYQQAISEVNDNGIRSALWAKRADILTQDFESDESIKVLHIKRGNLWQIDPVADLDSGDLYVLMSRKNLKERIKEAKQKQFSPHYLYSLLIKNSYIKVKQPKEVSLFPLYSEETEKEHFAYRMEDCERILGNYQEKIKRIIVVAVDYEAEIAITAHAIVYDSNYNVADDVDVSDYLLPATHTITHTITGESSQESTTVPLVKFRQNKKIQKEDK